MTRITAEDSSVLSFIPTTIMANGMLQPAEYLQLEVDDSELNISDDEGDTLQKITDLKIIKDIIQGMISLNDMLITSYNGEPTGLMKIFNRNYTMKLLLAADFVGKVELGLRTLGVAPEAVLLAVKDHQFLDLKIQETCLNRFLLRFHPGTITREWDASDLVTLATAGINNRSIEDCLTEASTSTGFEKVKNRNGLKKHLPPAEEAEPAWHPFVKKFRLNCPPRNLRRNTYLPSPLTSRKYFEGEDYPCPSAKSRLGSKSGIQNTGIPHGGYHHPRKPGQVPPRKSPFPAEAPTAKKAKVENSALLALTVEVKELKGSIQTLVSMVQDRNKTIDSLSEVTAGLQTQVDLVDQNIKILKEGYPVATRSVCLTARPAVPQPGTAKHPAKM